MLRNKYIIIRDVSLMFRGFNVFPVFRALGTLLTVYAPNIAEMHFTVKLQINSLT
jgi:hypothetical protein